MAYADFNLVRRWGRMLSDLAVSVQRQRTRRHVNDLPEHILKDIGWPGAYAERSGHPRIVDKTSTDTRSQCDARQNSPSQDLSRWPLNGSENC